MCVIVKKSNQASVTYIVYLQTKQKNTSTCIDWNQNNNLQKQKTFKPIIGVIVVRCQNSQTEKINKLNQRISLFLIRTIIIQTTPNTRNCLL